MKKEIILFFVDTLPPSRIRAPSRRHPKAWAGHNCSIKVI